MSDKLTAVRLKQADGTYTDQIPIWTTADNVAYKNNYTLQQAIGNINISTDGNIEQQLENLNNKYNNALAAFGTPLTAADASAMTDHDKIYVYVKTPAESGYTTGNWYYWNGSAWTSGGIYNSAGVETDTTLSITDVPADAKATGDKIKILTNQLQNFNSFDIWNGLLRNSNGTSGGVSYTWSDGICTIIASQGVSGNDDSANVVLTSKKLPDTVIPGETYYVQYKTTNENVCLRIIFKTADGGSSTYIRPVTYLTENTPVTVPLEARYWTAAIYISPNTALPTTVTVSDIHFLSAKTNKELSEETNDIFTSFSSQAMIMRGTLANGTDLDTIKTPGIWLLSSGYTYPNEPTPTGYAGILIVFPASNLSIEQIVYTLTSTMTVLHCYTRGVIDGNFISGWKQMDGMASYGVLPAETNLDTLKVSGNWVLQSGYSYVNSPISSSLAGLLMVFPGSANSIIQIVSVLNKTDSTNVHMYIRGAIAGSFDINGTYAGWKQIDGNSRDLIGKYIAFGDSLTKGAVWYPTYEEAVEHSPIIASYEYQIPTRIAKALGIENDFINEGRSGIGYVTVPSSGNQTLVDLIKSYTFTNVELVTIQAGPNDISKPLGTSAAIAEDGTICGAIKEIINYMRESYPTVQLIFIQSTPCLPPPYDTWSGKGSGINSWSLDDFDKEVSKLCYENHVGYVNWYGCTYVNTWIQRNEGYAAFQDGNGNWQTPLGPVYSHPNVESDYALIGDYIAGKIAAMGQNYKPQQHYETKKYTYNDATHGEFLDLNKESCAFNLINRRTNDSSSSIYSWLFIPVKKGDSVYLRTTAGTGKAKPYAILSQNYLISYTYTTSSTFVGTIIIEKDGYLAINLKNEIENKFVCEVTWNITDTARSRNFINALDKQVDRMWPEYDDDNVCRVIQTGPSLMGAIHHWAIVGASFDSGEFNYKVDGETKELEYYEYSCWEYLKKINGIPDLYNYSDGGQNGLDWIKCGPNDTRGVAYASDVEVTNPGWSGRSGIGYGGGCWWKMRADALQGDIKQAFVINLGSNDINNNYPWADSSQKNAIDPNYNPNNPNGKYLCGTINDIGTYDLQTDTDTLPSGVTPSTTYHIENFQIYNSYCAYIGAILNRILAFQHDAIIFLCTIRNGFASNAYKFGIWQEYNQALKNIAAMDRYKNNVYIVDNGTYGPNYATAPLSSMILGSHPNALGYQFIAGYWNTLLDYTIQKNYTKMTQSMFIGTGKSY